MRYMRVFPEKPVEQLNVVQKVIRLHRTIIHFTVYIMVFDIGQKAPVAVSIEYGGA